MEPFEQASEHCVFDAARIADRYMRLGWEATCQEYVSTDPTSSSTDRGVLVLLGAVRKYILTKSFYCNRTSPDQKLLILGSNNPTSDYDATVTGSGACDTVWRIFADSVRTYDRPLSTSLDVNVYAVGTYDGPFDPNNRRVLTFEKTGRQYHPECGKQEKKARAAKAKAAWRGGGESGLFTMSADFDGPDAVRQLEWAGVKLLQAGVPFPVRPGMPFTENVRTRIEARKNRLERLERAAVDVAGNAFPGKDDETLLLVAKYALQHFFAREVNRRLDPSFVFQDLSRDDVVSQIPSAVSTHYGPVAYLDVMDLMSHAMYFSIEGYYCQGTVNAVVLEDQGSMAFRRAGRPVEALGRIDYLCSIIENYADFTKHIDHDASDAGVFRLSLKYSKYIYRMVSAATRLGLKGRKYEQLRWKLYCRVFKHRGIDIYDDEFLSTEGAKVTNFTNHKPISYFFYTEKNVVRDVAHLKKKVTQLFHEIWADATDRELDRRLRGAKGPAKP